MYNQGDLSFINQPKFASSEVINLLAKRIEEHISLSPPLKFDIILHGGEPLLMGRSRIEKMIILFKKKLEPLTLLRFSIQTNGLLLDTEWIDLFRKYNIGLGISIDGPQNINDLHRLDHKGRGSFSQVVKAIEMCNVYRYPFALLGVLNPSTDPIEIYDFFKSSRAKNIDFLFPHHNHDHPPFEMGYGDWYIKIFEAWFKDNDHTKPNIRFLTQLILSLINEGKGCDFLGNKTNDYLVVETDGGIESVDALKICGDSFTKESFNIGVHSLSQALQSPLMNLYRISHGLVSSECSKCQFLDSCGGGFLPHRYRISNGFDNPTVYCNDMKKIISHIILELDKEE